MVLQYRACVTGGSRGIGRAVAAALSRAGHDVTVLGRTRATLDDVVAAGAARTGLVVDASNLDALAGAVAGGGYVADPLSGGVTGQCIAIAGGEI